MRLVAAALIFSSAATAAPSPPPPTIWNPKAPENRRLLPTFSIATVAPVLRAIGAKAQHTQVAPGDSALLTTFANGRTAVLSLKLCEQSGGCKALSIQSFWKADPAIPPERTAQALEKFNQRYAFAKAFVTPDGRPSLQRYLTADFGVIRGDLAINLLVFSDQAEKLAVEFLEPLAKGK
jgi:hypothetical protein